MKKIISAFTLAFTLVSCTGNGGDGFWRVEDGHFRRGSEDSVYFIGTNMWYAPILLSDTESADPDRLYAELDTLKSMGVTNLRVLAGADENEGMPFRVEPALQKSPGVYDENVFVGLDRFLAEIGKRGMSAVIYLNNSWLWSGGFSKYLEWSGGGTITEDAPWEEYMTYASRFVMNEKAKAMADDNIRHIVTRVNTVTGKPYKDDQAIFSWQICNEPRCFSTDDSVKTAFSEWLWHSAALIKSLDPNHLVSTGSEGWYGCEADMNLCEKIHSCPDIDYLTMHIWPFNWGWAHKETLDSDMGTSIKKTEEYMSMHIDLARKLGKPLVMEEFGFPRDGVQFSKGSSVELRDEYYSYVFGKVVESARSGGPLAGTNFWAWGGFAGQSEDNVFWHRGDERCGDPPQEQQGLYSVYHSDSTTVSLIKKFTTMLNDI